MQQVVPAFRITDYPRSKAFYVEGLGFRQLRVDYGWRDSYAKVGSARCDTAIFLGASMLVRVVPSTLVAIMLIAAPVAAQTQPKVLPKAQPKAPTNTESPAIPAPVVQSVPSPAKAPEPAVDEDNIDDLRRQMKEMQDRLERMSKEPKKEE